MSINMKAWCRDPDYDFLGHAPFDLTKPFVQDGFLYASDAAAIIRTPALDKSCDGNFPPNCGEFFKPFAKMRKFRPFPAKCPACNGNPFKKCGECGHVARCECQGFSPAWTFGKDVFLQRYMLQIKTLPNPKYAIRNGVLYVRFDGGEVIVQPLVSE